MYTPHCIECGGPDYERESGHCILQAGLEFPRLGTFQNRYRFYLPGSPDLGSIEVAIQATELDEYYRTLGLGVYWHDLARRSEFKVYKFGPYDVGRRLDDAINNMRRKASYYASHYLLWEKFVKAVRRGGYWLPVYPDPDAVIADSYWTLQWESYRGPGEGTQELFDSFCAMLVSRRDTAVSVLDWALYKHYAMGVEWTERGHKGLAWENMLYRMRLEDQS